jgi:hypothetical protein
MYLQFTSSGMSPIHHSTSAKTCNNNIIICSGAADQKKRHIITEKHLEWVFDINQYKSHKLLMYDISDIHYYLERNLDRKTE